MYPNQQQPIYTTRHYIHNPQSDGGNNYAQSYDRSRPSAQPYPYYTNNPPPPTSVTYINDRSNYGQQSTSYSPQNVNHYPPTNTHIRSGNTGPAGGGGIEKTNMMSDESPFYDPARRYENTNTPRTITSQLKNDGSTNKTLNLSDENPFYSTYGRYHYPSQIDPTKRITTQNATVRSTDNKSLNLSDESPFYSTYGRYHYPSQIDPAKRITEMPKAASSLLPTNETSVDSPFNNYQPPSYRDYSPGVNPSNNNWNRNNNPVPPPPPPASYRPNDVQGPPQNQYYQQQKPPSPPPAPARAQPQRPNPSAPLDKTSLNMSPDNPFAQTYGQYHYPGAEEIKAQKRANARLADQQPVNNNNRPVQQPNQMTEYPETEKKEVISGKGNTKFTRFDVNF